MPFTIDVRVDVRELTRNLTDLAEKQIPFATAQALNELGGVVKTAEVQNLKKTFPTATPFTLNSLVQLKARKDSPITIILIKDRTARYLNPFEVGGVHVLNSRALLNPKDITLNQYGNIPKGKLAALKANPNVFVGAVTFKKSGQTVSGVWLRPPRGVQTKKGRRTGFGTKGNNAQPGGARSGLKLLIRFGDALPVKERLHYQQKAAEIVQQNFAPCFNRAMAKALATAKA